jgi:protein-disulfide isomerase
MGSQEVNRRIQADIKQAKALGIDATPTLYVNGVRLRNWKDGSGLESAILAIARRKDR